MFIAFNINHSSILPLMALNGLYCANVPLSNYSLTRNCLKSLRDKSRLCRWASISLQAVGYLPQQATSIMRSTLQYVRPFERIYDDVVVVGSRQQPARRRSQCRPAADRVAAPPHSSQDPLFRRHDSIWHSNLWCHYLYVCWLQDRGSSKFVRNGSVGKPLRVKVRCILQ